MDLDQITKLAQNERVRRLLLSVLNRAGDGVDLNRLLDQLQQGGLQQQVQSWIHTAPGREITAAQIRDALGAANLDAAADAAGMRPEEAAETLADLLPQLVDRVSPGGLLPDATTLQDAFTQVLLGEPEPREDHP
ncbi:YidB family protein [Asanoa sp. NPDC049518]|uniref:YidB family protein n=1 Tax=unclassified Asanoa TaxID=2685164 RepID=UPI003428883A